MRRSSIKLWAAPLVSVVLIVLVLLTSPEVRDMASAAIGDDARNDLIDVYSSLTAPDTQTDDLVPISNTDVNPYAINVFLEQEVEDWKVRRTLQMVRDAGFHWIKQQVLWYDIETPGKGQYYDVKNNNPNTWLKYDRIVDTAREYGLNVIMRLDTSPPWARPGIDKLETPPAHFKDYGDFVYNVVSRYKGKVKYYQIWNEPNLAFEWGGKPPNAAEYVRLLRIAYQRAKEADPNCVIISAALAPTVEISPQAENDLVFLQQMYDAGASKWFDILGVNPYGLRSGPYDRRLGEENDVNFSRPILIRQIMVRNGDAGKAMWASELGWNALPPDFPGKALWGRVTREEQARYTVEAYQRMQEEWPWMGVAALWHFRMVFDVLRDQPQYYFGIVHNDFAPYPAYDAMKALATQAPVLYPGYHQETHWALQFSSQWRHVADQRAVLGGMMVSDKAGASLHFTFVGSDLDLVVAKDAHSGRLSVAIDGGAYAANRVARDSSGHAYVDLYNSSALWQQRIPIARGLPWGRHTVEIQLAPGPQGGTGAAIDGVVVAGAPPNVPRTVVEVIAPMLLLLVSNRLFRWRANPKGTAAASSDRSAPPNG